MEGLHLIPGPKPGPIAGQPRVLLGGWPTPIQRLENVSSELGVEVWAKREDLCGVWGGNKVRKLEFWLATSKVRAARDVIVSGAGTSTWTAAAAQHARERDLDVTAALAGPIPKGRRDLYERLEVRLFHHPNLNALPFVVAKVRLTSRGSVVLPMGGTGWPGDLGPFLCGIEVVDATVARVFPQPRAIFVAAGTSGTAAGLAAGLAHRGVSTPIVAVRVVPRPLGTKWRVTRRASTLLRKLGPPAPGQTRPAIVGEGRFFGAGYGKPGPGVDEAVELAARDGVELERTYTGKAFAALIAHARAGGEGPLLFIHTATTPTPSGPPTGL